MAPKRKLDSDWIAQFQRINPHYRYLTPSWLVGSNRYFTALCPQHGEFDVPAGQHSMGYSKCPGCKGVPNVRQPKPLPGQTNARPMSSKSAKPRQTPANSPKAGAKPQNTLLSALNSLNQPRKP